MLKNVGSESPMYAGGLNLVADANRRLGRIDEAAEQHRQALAIFEKASGAKDVQVGVTHYYLGEVARQQERHAEAVTHFEQALAIFDAAPGADRYFVGHALASLAETRLVLGAPALAVPPLERALAYRYVQEGDPRELAHYRFDLAQALWARGIAGSKDRERARGLAREAAQGYETLGMNKHPDIPGERKEIARWIEEHP
jgi:tetratricopeptide (TPR) repeat protein